jgi:hypothetical protein
MFAWTGFYAGVNGGYGGGVANPARSEQELDQIFGFGPTRTETDTKNINEKLRFGGGVAGGQFGYNRQLANRFVIGAETDLQWSDIRASRQSNSSGAYTDPSAGVFAGSSGLAISQHWFGTTRLRLGYQVFDRFLAYVTGGVAYRHQCRYLGWYDGQFVRPVHVDHQRLRIVDQGRLGPGRWVRDPDYRQSQPEDGISLYGVWWHDGCLPDIGHVIVFLHGYDAGLTLHRNHRAPYRARRAELEAVSQNCGDSAALSPQ